LIQFISFLN